MRMSLLQVQQGSYAALRIVYWSSYIGPYIFKLAANISVTELPSCLQTRLTWIIPSGATAA